MDLRKRRSQEKLQIALAEHLQTKTIDEITIGELTRSAGVSRQTFYSNFDSKQSILLNRVERLFANAKKNFEQLVVRQDLSREEIGIGTLRFMFDEIAREKPLMTAAFTGRAGIQCLAKLKDHAAEVISLQFLYQFNHNFASDRLEIFADFYAGALIGSVQGWLLDETGNKNIEDVIDIFRTLVAAGLESYLISKPT